MHEVFAIDNNPEFKRNNDYLDTYDRVAFVSIVLPLVRKN